MTRPAGVPSKIAFTNANVAKLPFAASGQYICRDTTLKNFFLVIGKREKAFVYQVDTRHLGKRHTVRKTIGRATDWDAAAARKEATKLIGGLQTGHTRPTGQGVTLGAAWASFRDQFAHQVDAGAKSAASLPRKRVAKDMNTVDYRVRVRRPLSLRAYN